jgi:ABC-2 type transport system permease protein
VRETIEASLRRAVPGFVRTVGIVAPEPSIPPEVMRQLQMQGRMPPQPPPEFQEIERRLAEEYAVEPVSLDAEGGVPATVDTLLVIRPQGLGEEEVFALDQYLMRGGRVVLCVGRYKADLSGAGLNVTPVETGVEDWLATWGVTVEDTLVLDDRNQPLPIPERRRTAFGVVRTWAFEPYPYLIEVVDDGIADTRVAGRVDALGIYWGSPVSAEPPEQSGVESRVLLRSSERSWTSADLTRVDRVGYTVPEEGLGSRPLAVALSGRFESAFAGEGAPANDAEKSAEGGAAEGAAEATEERISDVVLESSPDTHLVVIGNAEFLSDFVARVLGPLDGGYFEQNLDYVRNVIDWVNLDSDLASIRARDSAPRKIVRLERDAELSIEIANYLVPLLVLGVVAGFRAWRRRARAASPVVEG